MNKTSTKELIEKINKLESALSELKNKKIHENIELGHNNVKTFEALLLSSSIIENIQLGMHIYHLDKLDDDKTLRMIEANPAAEKLTGVKSKDIIGKTIDENFPGLREKGIPELYANVVRTGKYTEIEDIYYGDNRVIGGAFSVKAFPLPNNHVCACFENITEKKITEENLKQKADIINNTQLGIYVYQIEKKDDDHSLKLHFANAATHILTGIPENELIGKYIDDIFPNLREHGVPKIFAEVIRNQQAQNLNDLVYHDTRIITNAYSVKAFPLPNQQVGISFENITQRKRLEENLKEANEEFESINEELRESNEKVHETNLQLEMQKSHLNSIFKASPVGIAVSKDRVFTFANERFCQIAGYQPSEIINQSSIILFKTIAEFELAENKIIKQLHENGAGSIVTQWHQKSGGVVDIQLSFTYSDQNEPQKGITYAAQDITDKLEAEQDFANLFELSSDLICIASLDGYFLRINPSFTKTLGHSKEELISQPFFNFIHLDDVDETKRIVFEDLQKGKTILNFTNRYLCKDGTHRWLSWKSHPNTLLGKTYAIARDITAQKQIEEELIQSRDKAQESDRLKTIFLANMSHEIRTPMNGIIGFSELLRHKSTDENKREEYISIINRNGHHLLGIIDDIIDISRIESNQIKIENKEFNLNLLLMEIYTIYQNKNSFHRSESVKLKMNLSLSNKDADILADENRIRQILFNLINNSYKYTENGYIEFGYEQQHNKIQFFVKDNGIGVPNEKKKIIFERFRQADEGHSRKYGGTGLGLTISTKLVELMNGVIGVKDNQPNGSIFYFDIPLKHIENKSNEKINTNTTSDKKIDFKDKTILLVEDDGCSMDLLANILAPYNTNLLKAYNGEEAIKYCNENNNIDLILMDIQLPDMDGYETTSKIRLTYKNIPIIAQTAHAMKEDRQHCIDAGCTDYISKPIHSDKLIKLINSYL